MKNLRKKVFLGVLLLVLILSNVSCSDKMNTNSNVKNGSINDNSMDVTLKFVFWGNDERKQLTQQVIDLFEKKHPNIKVETQNYNSTPEERNQLAMDTAGQNMPDIIQVNYDFIFDYAKRNLFEPLDTYTNLNISDIDESILQGSVYDEKLYGIPFGDNAYCIAVNPLFFEKAGIDIPKSGYTYEDLYNVCRELKEKINDPNFYPLANFVDFNNYIRSMGATYYNQDGTSLGYDDDEIFIKYFEFYKKCLKEGLIAPVQMSDKNTIMKTGKSALWFGVSNQVSALSEGVNTPTQIITVPSKTEGNITSVVRPSMFLSVSAYSKHKKEAVDFVNFLINDSEANDILKSERGVSASNKISDENENNANEAEKQQYIFLKYLKEKQCPKDPPTPSTSGNVASLFQTLTDDILSENKTGEEAAKEFRSTANNILKGVKGGQ